MLRELPRAQRFILLEYFILTPGEMWDSILRILRGKAREGVEVRGGQYSAWVRSMGPKPEIPSR